MKHQQVVQLAKCPESDLTTPNRKHHWKLIAEKYAGTGSRKPTYSNNLAYSLAIKDAKKLIAFQSKALQYFVPVFSDEKDFCCKLHCQFTTASKRSNGFPLSIAPESFREKKLT